MPLISERKQFAIVYTADFITSFQERIEDISRKFYDAGMIAQISAILTQTIVFNEIGLETLRNAAIHEKGKMLATADDSKEGVSSDSISNAESLNCIGVQSSAAHIEEAMKDYKEYINSEETKKKREYMYYSEEKPQWTPEDYEKFEQALEIYKDTPCANKRIAKYMGDHIHPNHVRYERKEMRKKHKDNFKIKIACYKEKEGDQEIMYDLIKN